MITKIQLQNLTTQYLMSIQLSKIQKFNKEQQLIFKIISNTTRSILEQELGYKYNEKTQKFEKEVEE